MKKFLKVFLSLILCTFFSQSTAFAQTSIRVTFPYGNTVDSVPDKWQVHYTDNATGKSIVDLYGQIHIGSKAVYCVEPNIYAVDGASDYESVLMNQVYNEQQCQQAGWIYALGKCMDNSNEMDLACQVLLWKLLDNTVSNITYHPDIQAKMNEVEQRINIMKTNVNFGTNEVVLKGYGKEHAVLLQDQNNVFEHYIETSNTGVHTQKEGNTLAIWLEKGDNLEGSVSYDCFYSSKEAGQSIIYNSKTSQNVLSLEKSIPNSISLKVSLSTGDIEVHKVDSQGNYIPNISLKIVDSNQEVVDQWTTDDKSHVTSNLLETEVYTLIEESQDNGYICAKPVSFKINEVSSIELVNHSINVKKIDQNENYVENATLQVLDSQNNVVDQWKTHQQIIEIPDIVKASLDNKQSIDYDGIHYVINEEMIECTINGKIYYIDINGYETIHRISNLKEGETYTLHELETPSSYLETEDIEFVANQSQTIVFENTKVKTVTFKKVDENQNYVKGATLCLKDEEGNVIDEWKTSDSAHVVKDLIVGKTYILSESKTPIGYEKAEDITFVVDDKTDEIEMIDYLIKTIHTGIYSNTSLYLGLACISLCALFIAIYKLKQ